MKQENLIDILLCWQEGGKDAKLILLEDSFIEGPVLRNIRFKCPYEGKCQNQYTENKEIYCLKKKSS